MASKPRKAEGPPSSRLGTKGQTNLTICGERKGNGKAKKCTKHDLEIGEESTKAERGPSEGARMEKLKGKLREITCFTAKDTRFALTESPSEEKMKQQSKPQTFGRMKKSVVVLKDPLPTSATVLGIAPKETKCLGLGKRSIQMCADFLSKKSGGCSPEKTLVVPVTTKGGLGRTLVGLDANEEKGGEMWKSLTEKRSGKKLRGPELLAKLDRLRRRLRVVLKNCPKFINVLQKKLDHLCCSTNNIDSKA